MLLMPSKSIPKYRSCTQRIPKNKTQKRGKQKQKALYKDPHQSIKSNIVRDPPSIYNLAYL